MNITIIAHPNSKKPRIEKDLFGRLHVYINEPPLDGKANKAIIKSLAWYLDIKKTNIILVSGEKSKEKRYEISEN